MSLVLQSLVLQSLVLLRVAAPVTSVISVTPNSYHNMFTFEFPHHLALESEYLTCFTASRWESEQCRKRATLSAPPFMGGSRGDLFGDTAKWRHLRLVPQLRTFLTLKVGSLPPVLPFASGRSDLLRHSLKPTKLCERQAP